MELNEFKRGIQRLEDSLISAAQEGGEDKKYRFVDKAKMYQTVIRNTIGALSSNVWTLTELGSIRQNRDNILNILRLVQMLEEEDNIADQFAIVQKMKGIVEQIIDTAPQKTLSIKIPNLPAEIKDEVRADIEEINKCYSAGCYRSSTILCGRVLETALHRRYYDTTGFDILEKNPGIGLGKLIAKLTEKNVELDPGITQQIHLINQVRIFSVHKKQTAFNPTKNQAHAMILYTIDIIHRLFSA